MENESNNFYVYMLTDENRHLLETGVAGALNIRLYQLEHEKDAPFVLGHDVTCKYLIYWERFTELVTCMKREKEMRKLSHQKKKALIDNINPGWRFLNEEFVRAEI